MSALVSLDVSGNGRSRRRTAARARARASTAATWPVRRGSAQGARRRRCALNIDDAWSVKRVEQHRENGRGDGARGETYQLLQVAKGRELNEHDMWLMAAVLREAGDVLEVSAPAQATAEATTTTKASAGSRCGART